MATDKRKEYIVELGGVEHTMLIDPDEVDRYPNAKPGTAKAQAEKRAAETKAVSAPANK